MAILHPKNCDVTYRHKPILSPVHCNDQCLRSHMEVLGNTFPLFIKNQGKTKGYLGTITSINNIIHITGSQLPKIIHYDFRWFSNVHSKTSWILSIVMTMMTKNTAFTYNIYSHCYTYSPLRVHPTQRRLSSYPPAVTMVTVTCVPVYVSSWCLLLLFAGQLCGMLPLPRNGRTALVPAYISSVWIPSDLSKGHRFVSHRSVKPCAKTPRMKDTKDWNNKVTAYESTWLFRKLVHRDLAAGVSVQERVHKLAVILSFPRQISDVVELPYRRDSVSKSVMLSIAVAVRINLEFCYVPYEFSGSSRHF